jgi:hypothetical protein
MDTHWANVERACPDVIYGACAQTASAADLRGSGSGLPRPRRSSDARPPPHMRCVLWAKAGRPSRLAGPAAPVPVYKGAGWAAGILGPATAVARTPPRASSSARGRESPHTGSCHLLRLVVWLGGHARMETSDDTKFD